MKFKKLIEYVGCNMWNKKWEICVWRILFGVVGVWKEKEKEILNYCVISVLGYFKKNNWICIIFFINKFFYCDRLVLFYF